VIDTRWRDAKLHVPRDRPRRTLAACVIGLCYITDVKTAVPSWTLTLLALAASLTISVARQLQAPAPGQAGPASQDQPKNSAKDSANPSRRKIPCKTPENASLCYWIHGRLTAGSGDPSYRIWKMGTRRVLGVFNGPSHFPPRISSFDNDVFNPELPAELYRAYEVDNRRLKQKTGIMWAVPPPVFADFEVCPLEPERKGWMQAVCVESAKNIFIEKDY
jgi:hypothetical protein